MTGSKYAEVVALHAVAGGVISVLNGSKFGYGFVSAGFTKSLGHSIAQLGDNQELQSLVTVIVGGTASRLSGGKFANGATTAAFQVALNFFGGKFRRPGRVGNRVTVTTSVNEKTGEHTYIIRGLICSTSMSACNAKLADTVYADVNKNDIPFTEDDLREGYHELGPLNDPIEHNQNSLTRTSVNIALKGHTFFPGTVTHRVRFVDGSLYYEVIGTGTGRVPSFKNLVGVQLFQPSVDRCNYFSQVLIE